MRSYNHFNQPPNNGFVGWRQHTPQPAPLTVRDVMLSPFCPAIVDAAVSLLQTTAPDQDDKAISAARAAASELLVRYFACEILILGGVDAADDTVLQGYGPDDGDGGPGVPARLRTR